jgi:ABC-type antimicrobial peptide transport system permease subunit
MHTNYTRQDINQVESIMSVIVDNLKKLHYVEGISESVQFLPYMRPDENYWDDSVKISVNKKILSKTKGTDAFAYEVFKLKMNEGRWFTDNERPNGLLPAVITTKFKEKAEIDNPIGKKIEFHSRVYEIVGVISGIKESVFNESHAAVIVPISSWTRIGFYGEYVARVKEGYQDDFFNDYNNEFKRLTLGVTYIQPNVSELSIRKNKTMLGQVMEQAMIAIPSIFLLIFAFLGTIGQSLLDLKNRTSELAIRFAIGSSKAGLMKTVFLQNLFISACAAVPGIILTLFIYELNANTLSGILITLFVIFLFSAASSWYPEYMLTKINPAEALKKE